MAGLQILIADDHAAVRRSIRSLLESHQGWSVREVSNGREAIEQTRNLRPDVILLDMSMPEIDGLQATRDIIKSDPNAVVLILTTHESAALADEAERAGARKVITKSAAGEMLIETLESLSRKIVHLAGSIVGRMRHIAAFFRSKEERYGVLAPFIREGLENGEKALHIIDPPDRSAHLSRLMQSGVDLEKAESEGQARLISWQETYLYEDRFDQDAMADRIQHLLRTSASEGYPLTRVIGHMEWSLLDRPGVADLISYESRLNAVLPGFDDVVVCAYDVTKFSGAMVLDVIRSHPAILIGAVYHTNPFYVPPLAALQR